MIGNVTVRVSANNPSMPIGPIAVVSGSACTVGVLDVPSKRYGASVAGVSVAITNADGETVSVPATKVGCAWCATFGESHLVTPGSIRGGITVSASGTAEDGSTPEMWILGVGDVCIMSADAVPVPGMSWQDVHLRDAVPADPVKGDLAHHADGWKIWTGEAWSAIGGSAPVTSVNGQTGAVELTASDVGAVPLSVEPSLGRTAVYIVPENETNDANLYVNAEDGRAVVAVGATQEGYGELSVGIGSNGIGVAKVGKLNGRIFVGEHVDSGAVEIEGSFNPDVEPGTDNYTGRISIRGSASYIEIGGHRVATDEQVDEAKSELNARIDLIEATTRPNMNIVGSPKFNQGMVSGFSANDYLMFPTQVNVGQNEVYFYMSFTTGADVTTQQNLLDSWCGLAFAIQNGRAITAASSNGTTFETVESYDQVFEPNSSYRLILRFGYLPYPDGMEYVLKTLLASGSGEYEEISQEVFIGGPLHQTATYWGGANPQSGVHHIFGGTINLNECRMVWNGTEVWRGYDELPTVKFDPTAEEPLDTAEKIVGVTKAAVDEIKATVNVNNRFLVNETTAAIQTRADEESEFADEFRMDKGYDAVQGDAMVKLDKSVQTVTVAGGTLTVVFPDAVEGTVRDLCLYVNNTDSTTECAMTFPNGTYYGADGWDAAAQKGGITGYYFSEIPGSGWRVSREELKQFVKGA